MNADGEIESTVGATKSEQLGEEVKMGEASMVNLKPSEDDFVVTRSSIRR